MSKILTDFGSESELQELTANFCTKNILLGLSPDVEQLHPITNKNSAGGWTEMIIVCYIHNHSV